MLSQNVGINSASACIPTAQTQTFSNANNINGIQTALTSYALTSDVLTGSVGISTVSPIANLHVTSQPVIPFAGTVNCVVGSDVGRQDNVQIRADISGDLNNKYWIVYSGNNRTAYYVWYNVAGAGVDPIPPAPFGVDSVIGAEVAINTNDTLDLVAQATGLVLGALTTVFTTVYFGTADVFVTRVVGGCTRPPFDVNVGGTWSTIPVVFGISGSDITASPGTSFASINTRDSVSINDVIYTVTYGASTIRIVLDRPLPASVTGQSMFIDNDLLKLDRSNNVNLLTVDKSGHLVSARLFDTSYASDVAASADSVPIGGLYRAAVGHTTASENSITIRLV
jgi:hypothetical protein